MKIKIKEYFNSLSATTFDKSDIVNLLYNNGATYVNLNTISISLREYSVIGNYTNTTLTAQTYTIASNNVSRFYTDISNLAGVTKI